MADKDIKIDQSVITFVENCIANAGDLHKSAKAVLDAGLPNIAYHLAVLSLEEVGKAGLVAADAISGKAKSAESNDSLKDKLADHTFKLFWAFWQADRSVERLLPESFKDAQTLAASIHRMRMASLYASEEGMHVISHDEAESMVKMAEARLAIDNSAQGLSQIRPEGLEDLEWFMDAIKDLNTRAQIFSQESFAKYAELKDMRDWVTWLKAWIEEEKAKTQALLQEELNREFPNGDEKFEPKWKVRFKLVTSGVTILSQQAFNEWNAKVPRVQFIVENNNKNGGKLIVDLYFPQLINLKDLHEVARQEMYRIILALNIGTMGFYWWYNLQPFIQKYEFAEDLEKKMRVGIEVQNPYINVWKKNEPRRTMNADDIERLIWCYFMLPTVGELAPQRKFYGHYMQALVCYSKHEAELPMMINAGMSFLECLYEAMLFYGEVIDKKSFAEKFYENFNSLLKDDEDQALFRSIVEPYSAGNADAAANKMTTDAATKMKIFCDSYLLQKFKAQLPDRLKQISSKIREEEPVS